PLAEVPHSWPTMSRASAASLARCTTPPTAASRCVNWSSSSGRRSRLARRRRFSSARPPAKSKLSKALFRRPRSPIMASVSAFCRMGSSRARLTRRPKWPRDSGTRFRSFLDRFLHGFRCCHRRQAYGSGANDGALIAGGVDHRIWMRGESSPRKLWVLCRHFDRVGQAVEGAGEHGGHETVLPRQRSHRLERAAGALAIRRGRICGRDVELDQAHRGDRVLGERLGPLPEASQLVTAGAVEVTPQLQVVDPLFSVERNVRLAGPPMAAEALLRCAHRGPQRPHLVAQLAAGTLRV